MQYGQYNCFILGSADTPDASLDLAQIGFCWCKRQALNFRLRYF
jgi:hypothetical protein